MAWCGFLFVNSREGMINEHSFIGKPNHANQ